MPRKQIPEAEYDPIAAEVARSVVLHGKGGEPPLLQPPPAEKVVALEPKPRSRPKREAPLSRPEPQPEPKKHQAKAHAGPRDVFKHFKVTKDEDLDLMAFVQRLQQKSRSKVTFSIVARALFHIAMHAEEEIGSELSKGLVMDRPANEDEGRLAQYEEVWIQKLSAAVRRSRPFQPALPETSELTR